MFLYFSCSFFKSPKEQRQQVLHSNGACNFAKNQRFELRKHVGHPMMSCQKTLCALLIHILNWLCPKPKATNICQVYMLCTSMMESCLTLT